MQITPLGLSEFNAEFVKLLCADGEPYQVLREILKNCFQAGSHNISIGPELVHSRKTLKAGHRVDKLCVIDDGCGMDHEELPKFFRALAESGDMSEKTRSSHERIGIGAKIASLPKNHAGVDVISYKNSLGHMIRMGYDSGRYGLLNFKGGNICIEVPSALDKEYKRDHGTIYILRGMTEDENTYPLPGTTVTQLNSYLNRRFFKIPPGVTVQFYQPPSLKNDPQKTKWILSQDENRNQLGTWRNIYGTEYYLDKYKVASGTFSVAGGIWHWWTYGDKELVKQRALFAKDENLFPEEDLDPIKLKLQYEGELDDIIAARMYKTGSAQGVTPGVTGILFQDEVYEHSTAPGRMMSCGIHVTRARRRVALIFEPIANTVMPNPSRSRLHPVTGTEDGTVPWSDWASSFLAEMPSEVEKIASEHDAYDGASLKHNIYDMLNPLKDYWDWTSKPDNSVRIKPVNEEVDLEEELNPENITNPEPETPPAPENESEENSDDSEDEGENEPENDPKNKKPEKEIEKPKPPVDRRTLPEIYLDPEENPYPAYYAETPHALTIYTNHPLLTETARRIQASYTDVPGAAEKIEKATLEQFGCEACQRVVGAYKFKTMGTPYGHQTFEKMLSQEALLAGLCGILTIEKSIRATLGGRLGHKRDKKQTEGE